MLNIRNDICKNAQEFHPSKDFFHESSISFYECVGRYHKIKPENLSDPSIDFLPGPF